MRRKITNDFLAMTALLLFGMKAGGKPVAAAQESTGQYEQDLWPRRGEFPVRAGDVVLLGSLVQTQWVTPGDHVEVRNDLLGEVAASFVAP